jgi:hypothetical protein
LRAETLRIAERRGEACGTEAGLDAAGRGTSEDASATNAASDSSASKDGQAGTTGSGTGATIEAGVGDDGRPHEVRVLRSSGILTVYVDGHFSGLTSAPTSLGKLSPVTRGTDPCIGSDMDTTMALVGSLVNLCVTSP